MRSWTRRAKVVWAIVVALALATCLAIVALPQLSGMHAPSSPSDWLILIGLTAAATYLGLRPVQTAPDRRLTAASAPVIALPLLFDPLTAVLAAGSAVVISHVARRAAWHVTAFNVSQRTIGVVLTGWLCSLLTMTFEVSFFLPCVVAATSYFLTNTLCVSAISAARKRLNWPLVWWTMVREQWIGEAGLLIGGVLVAIHVRTAPLAVPLIIPPLWLAWRVVAGAVEIRRLNATLQEALDYQRRFVADASHELRTPIASLRAQLEALRSQVGSASATEVTARLDDMASETARVGALLSDLLALARADSGTPIARQRVNLEEVLLDVYRELRPLAGQVRLSVQLDGEATGGPTVIGDHERLRQLVLNLGANAVRFTAPDGEVQIRCGVNGEQVRIEVTDTGIGIAPEDLPYIFDRFYRADSGRARESDLGGSGLGLAIARSIVEAHGGSIQARSVPDEGSVFTVLLPLAPPDSNESPAEVRSGARAATAGAR